MGKKILVVDDDDEVIRMMEDVLTAEGHVVIPCRYPTEAFDVARRLMPDIVVVDVVLGPDGGWQLIDQIRTDPVTRQLRVLVLTGDLRGAEAKKDRLRALGCDLLIKPFELTDLLGLLGG